MTKFFVGNICNEPVNYEIDAILDYEYVHVLNADSHNRLNVPDRKPPLGQGCLCFQKITVMHCRRSGRVEQVLDLHPTLSI